MNDKSKPLKIMLHGFDPRATKMLAMYLQGQCRGIGQVVNNPEDADADLYDADIFASKKLLLQQVQDALKKPTIALSINELTYEGVLHIKKPVNADNMVQVLETAKKHARESQYKSQPAKKTSAFEQPAESNTPQKPAESLKTKKAEKPKASSKVKSSEKSMVALNKDAEGKPMINGGPKSRADNDNLEVDSYSEMRNKNRSEGSDLLQETSDWFDL